MINAVGKGHAQLHVVSKKLTEDGDVWLVLPSTDGETDSLALQGVTDQLEGERGGGGRKRGSSY